MLSTPVGRVRAAGLVEGTSALVLFFVAMPLKYLSGMPELGKQVVFYVGAVHGGLFVLYALVTLAAWARGALAFKLVCMAAVASVVPFGPFVIDRVMRRREARERTDTAAAQR